MRNRNMTQGQIVETITFKFDTEAQQRAFHDVLEGGRWQPIETAPKDKAVNRKVLVSVPNGKNHTPRTMLARYYGRGGLEVAEGYEGEDWAVEINGEYYMPEGWYEEFEGEDAPSHNIEPTHWMPLPPPPPTSLESSEGGRK
jgi:hypothetical protein